MTKRLYVLPCLLFLLISSVSAAGTRLTNAPGNVVEHEPFILTGHFEIRPPRTGEPFLDNASGGGGACLIAENNNPVSPCDVSIVSPSLRHYCIPDGGHSGSGLAAKPTGTIWVQPEPTAYNSPCYKLGPDEGPGNYDTPRFDATAHIKQSKATKWRVYSCLNGPPGACGPGSGAVERVTMLHRLGPISEIPFPVEPLPLRYPIWIYISIAFAALVLGSVVYFRRRQRTL